MPQGPQRHPSRDPHPSTGDYLNTSSPHETKLVGKGYYETEELNRMPSYYREEGNEKEARSFDHIQGALFDVPDMERRGRVEQAAKRMTGFDPRGDESEVSLGNELRDQAFSASRVPTSHLQPREKDMWVPASPGRGAGWQRGEPQESKFVLERGLMQQGVGGHYTGPPDQHRSDYVTIDPGKTTNASHLTDRMQDTIIHEAGHRQHLASSQYGDSRVNHPKGMFPDPLKEAHADAYVDRYGGPTSEHVAEMRKDVEHSGRKFQSYQHTGYSTDPERATGMGWRTDDRAVYAGVRAHASETGEHTDYQKAPDTSRVDFARTEKRSDPVLDATIHHLMSTSPHAVQALRQTGLKEQGAESFRRHRDRQLLSQGQQVQHGLFDEIRGADSGKVLGYTPTDHATGGHMDWGQQADVFDSDVRGAEGRSGEVALLHHMSHNQFGEAPRTVREVQQTTGVYTQDAKRQGFIH